MTDKRFAIYTLGCKLNFSESSTIARQFQQAGYQQVDFNQQSDVYIINTCSVTQLAEKKCRNIIHKAIKANNNALVVVVGCYAQLSPETIATIDGVDLVINNRDKAKIVELVSKNIQGITSCSYKEMNEFSSAWSLDDRTRSFLKVQDGCDYFCSYCTIPKARGRSRSDTIENVIKNAQNIVNQGVKEIILTGVNIGDFGRQTGESFYDLLVALHRVNGLKRLRLSSVEPNLLDDRIIELVKYSSLLMPHFHIPLQCGTNRLLSAMNRKYTVEDFSAKIHTIRNLIPDAFIAIDLIVGVPEETEKDFDQTIKLIESLDLSEIHIFTYSQRPQTKAYSMKQVPMHVRRVRSQILHDKAREIHIRFCERFIGQTRQVLFEKSVRNQQREGFTDNYLRVAVSNHEDQNNMILPVELKKFNPVKLTFSGELKQYP